jgi:hypothetical protein
MAKYVSKHGLSLLGLVLLAGLQPASAQGPHKKVLQAEKKRVEVINKVKRLGRADR